MNRIFGMMIPGILLFAGCQGSISTDYDKLDIASVSGNVKFDGKPLANAYIIFQADNQTYSYGKTDSSGDYLLMLNTEKAGILPGKKTVRIRLSRAFGAEGASLDGKSTGESGSERAEGEGEDEGSEKKPKSKNTKELPNSYHKNSKIIVNVESGRQSFDFDLKADGTTTSSL